jgi:2',3'-cyclic-nucleotide 3'-phosphodiesterase
MVCTKVCQARKRKKSVAKQSLEKSRREHFSQFVFLSNQNVIRHVNRSKTMFIMRGLPGSGKSTLVKKIQAKYKGAVVCSADNYFSNDGEYKFEHDELSYAHQECKNKAKEACDAGEPVVVIDNTNIRRWEMNNYFGIAHQKNYDVILVEPLTTWKFDPVELAKQNSHGVTEEVIRGKVSHFQTVFPLYYGWFLNETESVRLMKFGEGIFRRCMDVPEFCNIFKKEAGVGETDKGLYVMYVC